MALSASSAFASFAILACLSAGDEPPIDTSSSVVSYGGTPSVDAGTGTALQCLVADAGQGACTNLTLCGAKVKDTIAIAAAPKATGGAITPGIYVLTTFTNYAGSATGITPTTYQQTMQFAALGAPVGTTEAGATDEAGTALDATAPAQSVFTFGQIQVIGTGNSGASSGTVTFDEANGVATFDQVCPPPATTGQSALGYSASPNSLTLYYAGPTGGTSENVFALQ